MSEPESEKSPHKKQPAPPETREQRLARQLRENLAKRKAQSRQRNTKPRKFKKSAT